MKHILPIALLFLSSLLVAQEFSTGGDGWVFDYDGTGAGAPCWSDSDTTHYLFLEDDGTFRITGKGSSTPFSSVIWNGITDGCSSQSPVDMGMMPVIYFRAKASVPTDISVQVADTSGLGTNCDACSAVFSLTTDWQLFEQDMSGRFLCQYGDCEGGDLQKVDSTVINTFFMNPGVGTGEFADTVWIDFIAFGNVDLGVVGVEDAHELDELKVFPNPTVGTELFFTQELHAIEVYDVHGKLQLAADKGDALNISGLKNGLYYLISEEGRASFLRQ